MRQDHQTLQLLLGTCVFAVAVALCAPARADDKSAALYKQKCVACHGADGKGETPAGKSMKAGSFADPAVAKMTDDELAAAVTNGKGKMPAYGKSLKADEIKGLVAYIRTLTK